MDNYQNYTKEELLNYIKTLENTIRVQNATINRMLDAFVLNEEKSTN